MQHFNHGNAVHANQYEQLVSQLNPTEMKKAIEQLKNVKPWGKIIQAHLLLEGAWFVDSVAGNGIIISKKAANDLLSDEAVRLGIMQPDEYLAYPANKSMDIVLFDSTLLRAKWLELLGIKGEKADLESLRIERSVNLNWPIYFDPCGLKPASHGYAPNPRFTDQRIRIDRVNHYRAIGHQDVIDQVHINSDLMLGKTHQGKELIILESFDGRMYGLPKQDYRPDEGYQLVTDYPNLIPVNELDDCNPMERTHLWAIDSLEGILGDALNSQPFRQLTKETIYDQFYQFGVDTGFKTHNRINQRQVHEGLEPDIPETPTTEMQSAATVIAMTNTVRTAMGFMLDFSKAQGVINDEMEALAMNGFIEGIMITPYPNHYSLVAAGQKEIKESEAKLEALMEQQSADLAAIEEMESKGKSNPTQETLPIM